MDTANSPAPSAALAPGLPPVRSEDEDIYQVLGIRYANAPARRSWQNFMHQDVPDHPMPLDFFIWVIRNPHRTVLVDTGCTPELAERHGWKLIVEPVEALRRLGIDPDQIDDIILTHLHIDHTGYIGHFGKARFHVQEDEMRFATGRSMSRRYLREAFAVDDIATLIRRVHDGRVRFHSGVSEVFPGISLHLLPGHSAGLQGVGVQTARGFVLLASDSSHYYANMLLQNATRITVDQIATYRSYDRLMQIAGSLDHIVPGHDPKIRRLYPTKDLGGLMVTMLHALPLPHDPADLARLDDYAID